MLTQARQVIFQPDLVLPAPAWCSAARTIGVRPGTVTAVITIRGIGARGGGRVRPSLRLQPDEIGHYLHLQAEEFSPGLDHVVELAG